ncbi:hypothetical protein GJAV_G00221350 [Gymnothorax javanicus]|nr:hypothetical protein GJAV_G00221350 [Gymnothorax javanicus]
MGKKRNIKPDELSQRRSKKEQFSKKKSNRDAKSKQEEHMQQIPFRLREIMKSKERMNLSTRKMRMKNKANKKRPGVTSEIPVPHFRQRPGESEKAYVRRMNRETEHVLFLTKNQLERQPELEEQSEENPVDKCKSEKKMESDKVRLQRLRKKKIERREEKEERDLFTDTVCFGEVAMAPPCLTTKPKKAVSKTEGATKGLLLNSLLGHSPISTAKSSMARQRIMEEERQRVVQAYRHLKKMKQDSKESQGLGPSKLKNLE